MSVTITKLQTQFVLSFGLLYRRSALTKPLDNNKPSAAGYIQVQVTCTEGKKYIALHRVKFILQHGYVPKLVDHIDGNKLNNSLDNLREADHRMNGRNSIRKDRGLPRGVYPMYRPRKPYVARAVVGGKMKHLGYFQTPEEASLHVEAILQREHGEFYRAQ